MVLRTPYAKDEQLRSSLSRVSISLEARIVNGQTSDRDAPPASEIIYNGIVGEDQEPIIISDDEVTDEVEGRSKVRSSYAIWKLSVFLSRPRIRLQGPSIVFQAAASVRVASSDASVDSKKGYLQSGVPSGLNLLESFGGDPALGGVKPRLSALRVSRVAPVTHPADQLRPIKGLQNLTFKIHAAVHTRVRFARPNTTPPSPALIALLEVDFTPYFDCEVLLDNITLSVTEGSIEDINPTSLSLPLSCVAHDHVTFLYRLTPLQLDIISKNPTRDLDIALQVTALLSDNCTPRLNMSWSTAIDFTLPVNPGFGQPIPVPIQRSHKPSQLSIGGQTEILPLISPRVSRPDALPSLEAAAARSTEIPVPDFGITMTFSAPTEPVKAGEEFVWSVFVVNRSKPPSRPQSTATLPIPPPTPVAARKLALIPIPRGRTRTNSTVRPTKALPGLPGRKEDIAEAVLDDAVVHAGMARADQTGECELVCLSADIRVGPLAAGACAVVELRFLALGQGVAGVEAVRVVDLGTNEHVDVRELPVAVVE